MGKAAPLIAFSLTLPLCLGACGDSESPAAQRQGSNREQVEAVAERFAAAVAAKDARAFCATLAPNDVERLDAGRSDGAERCLVVWGKGRNPLFEADDPDLAIEEITKLDATIATAKLAGGGRLSFTKEGGAWHVHLAPAEE